MSGRQSKWERTKIPEKIFLQQRDKDIISAVYEYRYLSRDQIQTLFNYNCVSKANLRLRKLYDNQYLSRNFLATERGSLKAVYFLGNKGIQIISERCGIDPVEVKRDLKAFGKVKGLFLDHHLTLNDVRISFVQAIRNNSRMKLERWINDHDCTQEYYINNSSRQVRKIIRPDSYFRCLFEKKIFSFFLEIDRSTMSQKRFKAKVNSYLEFARSGYYQKIFGVQYFRVLIIAPSVQRMINLKKTVEEATNKIFWFTTLDKVIDNNGFGPIWVRAGHYDLFQLIEC